MLVAHGRHGAELSDDAEPVLGMVSAAGPIALILGQRLFAAIRRAEAGLDRDERHAPEVSKDRSRTASTDGYEKPIQRPAAATVNHSASEATPVSAIVSRPGSRSGETTRRRIVRAKTIAGTSVVIFTQNA